MPDTISRRDSFKSLGIIVGGTFFPWSAHARNEHGEPLLLPDQAKPFTATRPVTAITLGAGSRGNVYGDYAATYPQQLRVVGVAEPIPIRQERYSQKHAIAADNRFVTWEHVFRRPKFADAVIISTPDNLHYGPCMDALRLGYDVLLEKPISPSERECRDILALTRKSGRIVAVCHVLRYAPYFVKMRELLRSGAIGRLISVQHMEPIEHTHMAHSYVRGNWHDSKKTTPILLAKSCHDLDILRWMIDSESRRIQAFGDLAWFKAANAPAGSTARCTDGCAVEKTCPYSARRIYYDKRERLYVFDLPEAEDAKGPAILEHLRTTNYGRCVYRMENDQPDHYVANMVFANGVTASFSMEAFSPWGGRRTRVMGSMGFIEGDMDRMDVYDFRTGEKKTYESTALDVDQYAGDGHGGGDWRLAADFVRAVAAQDGSLLSSTIDVSIESHIMGFAAEKSRRAGTVETREPTDVTEVTSSSHVHQTDGHRVSRSCPRRQVMGLLLVALFGFLVPNGFLIYWLFAEFNGFGPVLHDNLALAFILDVFVTLMILSVYFAKHPLGPVRWPWFVVLSCLGGLGFSLPFYYWLNRRAT